MVDGFCFLTSKLEKLFLNPKFSVEMEMTKPTPTPPCDAHTTMQSKASEGNEPKFGCEIWFSCPEANIQSGRIDFSIREQYEPYSKKIIMQLKT